MTGIPTTEQQRSTTPISKQEVNEAIENVSTFATTEESQPLETLLTFLSGNTTGKPTTDESNDDSDFFFEEDHSAPTLPPQLANTTRPKVSGKILKKNLKQLK